MKDDLMLHFAKSLPPAIIVKMLKASIEKWEEAQTVDNMQSVIAISHLLVLKEIIDREGMEELLKKIDNLSEGYDLMSRLNPDFPIGGIKYKPSDEDDRPIGGFKD